MSSASETRRLRLTFQGEGFSDGAVPIGVLAAKLQALQTLLFHAAAAVSHDKTARRGLWFNRYREVAELTFSDAHHSDLTIELDIAKPEPYLDRDFDIGAQAMDLVFDFGDAVHQSTRKLNELQISRDDHAYLLRAFENLLPNSQDNYQVILENCSPEKHKPLVLTGQTRDLLRRYVVRESTVRFTDEAVVVGELIKIHVDVGPEKITVRQKGAEIDCFYPDALRDQVANLLAGSIVEVTGAATLDHEGRVSKIDTIFDVQIVNMDPLRVTRFENAAMVYRLKKPLIVTIEYDDGMWAYHNSTLNLWGVGERREKALEDLHINFAYLWQEFAEEDDAVLDEHAQRIKQALLDMTERQPAGV